MKTHKRNRKFRKKMPRAVEPIVRQTTTLEKNIPMEKKENMTMTNVQKTELTMKDRVDALVPDLANEVLFIGIGQGGCNIANKFKELGYTSYYINSAARDLELINMPKDFKYHIPGARGCNKNRLKAKEYGKVCYQQVAKDLLKRFTNYSTFIFCFSMGGGTGSGVAPMIMQALSKIAPEINICIIAAAPGDHEAATIRRNGVDCYNDLLKLDFIGNRYIVDNGMFETKEEMERHNTVIANKIHGVFQMSSSDNGGNIDEGEVLESLAIKGTVMIADVIDADVVEEGESRLDFEPSFLADKSLAKYAAFGLAKDEDFVIDEIKEQFGLGEDFLKGYGAESSFVVIYGQQYPQSRFKEMGAGYLEHRNDIAAREKAIAKEQSIDLAFTDEKSTKKDNADVDFDNLFDGLF